ncbi:hypothetical protein BT93_L4867 [Corymbia citriodora subsp. variegata]|uniref:Dihydroorotate dehydrogenase (fumarate) n=1 Tax=Corymbia citriodora subsp. variegata TaxID=360336 RepID=A0A8T0CGF8_CORYI|nr:hypothetical protein BT93_L4867 [Corymbia citriodora subsp. variegata]
MPFPKIDPPLLNSANPWCTTEADLRALYECPYTGAVTTRTSLLKGFNHDPSIHQHTFFDPREHKIVPKNTPDYHVSNTTNGSLNTLGYSPIPLSDYLSFITSITSTSPRPSHPKPFIISVTGSPSEVLQAHTLIRAHVSQISAPLAMEMNLSCPNIPSKPPPAYSGPALLEYLSVLPPDSDVPVGIKTPPYTYHDQFATLISALKTAAEMRGGKCPVAFVTATNTLGNCLLLGDEGGPVLNSAGGEGVGGMAGAPLHPLALGNVKTLRRMLDEVEELKAVVVIGVGGVGDKAGFERMRAVGAEVVGVGTALGRKGVDVFSEILEGKTT